MGLVSYVSNEQAPEAVKSIYQGMEKQLGVVPNVFRTMAHSPEMLKAFLALNATLHKTELDGKLRELAYIKTSQLNDCAYCLEHHNGFGRKAGLSERQITEVNDFESSDAYSELEKDVLRYAEEVTGPCPIRW
ncbi:carboxymuconolactone decarboxylase family protein [Singulisphaera sp. PoT]|uniref:carboxymuconolactone decarboxylase family protein n=1 Tax=Singulisphaera sp. PoT TaxID=3411797 RepID=UPI003BF4CE34